MTKLRSTLARLVLEAAGDGVLLDDEGVADEDVGPEQALRGGQVAALLLRGGVQGGVPRVQRRVCVQLPVVLQPAPKDGGDGDVRATQQTMAASLAAVPLRQMSTCKCMQVAAPLIRLSLVSTVWLQSG